jgi:hypothetical protein
LSAAPKIIEPVEPEEVETDTDDEEDDLEGLETSDEEVVVPDED